MFWASKFFIPDKILVHILCQFQTFCAKPKDDFHSVNSVFVPARKFWSSTKCNSISGLAQNIWSGTKHFGTCRRTSALSFYRSQNILGWLKSFVPDQKFSYILCRSQIFLLDQKMNIQLLGQYKVVWSSTNSLSMWSKYPNSVREKNQTP